MAQLTGIIYSDLALCVFPDFVASLTLLLTWQIQMLNVLARLLLTSLARSIADEPAEAEAMCAVS